MRSPYHINNNLIHTLFYMNFKILKYENRLLMIFHNNFKRLNHGTDKHTHAQANEKNE